MLLGESLLLLNYVSSCKLRRMFSLHQVKGHVIGWSSTPWLLSHSFLFTSSGSYFSWLATTSNVLLYLFIFYTLLEVASFPKHFAGPKVAVIFNLQCIYIFSVHVAISSLFRVGFPDISLHGDEGMMHPMVFGGMNA